jgi:rubrerythrin
MDRNLTSLEVIGLAVRSEEDAAKFYSHLAGLVANDLVHIKFKHLSKEEVHHRKLLIDLYKQMSGTHEKPAKVPGRPQTAEGGNIPAKIADSFEDLLKLAIEREQKAHKFYAEALKKALDLTGQKILQYLADVEKGHEKMLKQEQEAFLRDKDWYLGKLPELIHAGP